MNKNNIIVCDFETGSKNPYNTQPIEFAMIAINARRLEIIPGSEFVSLMKPMEDEEALKAGLAPLEDEALNINHKTREELKKAPSPKMVWNRVKEHVERYNPTKKKWDAPIFAGYNSDNFDWPIVNRLCCAAPYKFGPMDDEYMKNKLFHPIHTIDVMKYIWVWTENNPDIWSVSLDTMREWMGIDKTGSHEAMKDVYDTANLLIKFLRLHRHYSTKVKFANSFGGNKNESVNV